MLQPQVRQPLQSPEEPPPPAFSVPAASFPIQSSFLLSLLVMARRGAVSSEQHSQSSPASPSASTPLICWVLQARISLVYTVDVCSGCVWRWWRTGGGDRLSIGTGTAVVVEPSSDGCGWDFTARVCCLFLESKNQTRF